MFESPAGKVITLAHPIIVNGTTIGVIGIQFEDISLVRAIVDQTMDGKSFTYIQA